MTDVIRHGITLLRHGRVEGAPALYGRSDPMLASGALQPFTHIMNKPHGTWQRVLCSPRVRCLQVATPIADHFAIPLDIWPELAEMDFGDWDGIPYADLVEQWPHFERFWADPMANPLPGAELLADFHQRILSAWQRMLAMSRDGSVLVVTHGGVIRLLLAHLLHADWRRGDFYQCLTIPYASLTQLDIWHTQDEPAIQIRQLASVLADRPEQSADSTQDR